MSSENGENPYAPPVAVSTISALGSDQTLKRVATGLALVFWGIAVVLASVVAAVVVGIGGQGLGQEVLWLLVVCSVGIIAGIAIGFVGRLMWLAVPAKTRAQGLIYGAVVFDVLALGIHVYDVFTQSEVLDFLGNICSFIAIVLFVLFLKRISQFVGRVDLADRAGALLGWGVGLFLVAFLGGIVAVSAPMVAVLVGLGIIALALAILVLYLRLLRDLRLAILAG